MATRRNTPQDDYVADDNTEFRGSPTMGVAVISGATFDKKSVTYYEMEGMAMFEGDIALGTIEDVKRKTEEAREAVASDPNIAFGVGITGSQFRWPNCRVPYEIDPALPNKSRVTDAIAHWEAKTAFRFPLKTGSDPNWIRFTDAGGCWSMVGMQGGQQTISLGSGCSTGNAIHEIGHAVGLWHEQSRQDRDLFVTINWANIQSGMSAQFNQHITDGDDLGAYDYGSIMHYPRTAFSKNGLETITPTNPAAVIGQRNGLSPGDIAAVRQMYPGCGVIKHPWLEPPPFKKIIDDNRFKKLRDDPLKIWRDPLKHIGDPIKISDPINVLRPEIITNPAITGQPGVLQPFNIATPHHAPLQGTGGGGAGAMAGMQQQMLDLQAALAEAHARAAQANADANRLQETADAMSAALDSYQSGGG